jgi:hypothetical protein
MKAKKEFTVEKHAATNVHVLKCAGLEAYVVLAQVGSYRHANIISAKRGYREAKNEAKRFIRANYRREGRAYA